MDPRPSDDDISLLNRLNALKPSTVQLEHRKVPYGEDEDDYSVLSLRERFLGLGTSSRTIDQDLEPVVSSIDPDEDVEELLAELRQNILQNPNNDREVERDLLGGAKSFLASSSRLTESLPPPKPDEKVLDGQDEDLEPEAEEYVERVLGEFDSSRQEAGEPPRHPGNSSSSPEEQYHTPGGPRDDDGHSRPFSPSVDEPARLDLPNTPSTPLPSLFHEYENEPRSPVEDLPAVPTFAPAERPVRIKSWTGANDDVSPSWCCICSDDARVECLDCGKQLYCRRCWRETHLEEGAEGERMHRTASFRGRGLG
ncbi:hypothetical protein VTO42DRAFT_6613 [Malbranchea cinnamomea]